MSIRHCCLNVRGFLSNTRFPSGYVGVFKHDDGRPMSPAEARETLYDELAKGHEVIPCVSADQCPGFDFTGGGCPGHPDQPNEGESIERTHQAG